MMKRVLITIDQKTLKEAKNTAKKMGMTLSAFLRFILVDKVAYFNRHGDKYFRKSTKAAKPSKAIAPNLVEEDISDEEFEKLFRKD